MLLGRTSCWPKRHWVMDEEQAVAAVWSGAESVGCRRLQYVVCMQEALHHLGLANYDLWCNQEYYDVEPAGKHGPGRATRLKSA